MQYVWRILCCVMVEITIHTFKGNIETMGVMPVSLPFWPSAGNCPSVQSAAVSWFIISLPYWLSIPRRVCLCAQPFLQNLTPKEILWISQVGKWWKDFLLGIEDQRKRVGWESHFRFCLYGFLAVVCQNWNFRRQTSFMVLDFLRVGGGSGEESFLLPRVQCAVHVGDNPLLAGSAVIYYLLQIEKNSQGFVYFLIWKPHVLCLLICEAFAGSNESPQIFFPSF